MSGDLIAALGVEASQVDRRQWSSAQVIAVDVGAQRVTALLNGGLVRIPYGAGATYAVNDTVAVLMDSLAGPLVLLKLATAPAPGPIGSGPSAPFTALIRPTWSGTYRTGSGWDRWNTTRYGGRSDLYQGNAYGSGVLVGLATYGDQVAALGASSIVSITAHVVISNNTGTPVLQGASDGVQPAGAPSVTGLTYTGTGDVPLGSVLCDAMRTGAVKGLATVGPTYVAIRGTSLADGMTLSIAYTKLV